jgi:hypothetical protein
MVTATDPTHACLICERAGVFLHLRAGQVVTVAGNLYRYEVPEAGGACKLDAEDSLLDHPSEVRISSP